MSENSNHSPSEVLHLESGVLIFQTTASEFIKKLGVDALYVDFEDCSFRTFTAGDDDWRDLPPEHPDKPKVVPLKSV